MHLNMLFYSFTFEFELQCIFLTSFIISCVNFVILTELKIPKLIIILSVLENVVQTKDVEKEICVLNDKDDFKKAEQTKLNCA